MSTYEGDKLSRDIRNALEVGAELGKFGFGYGAIADLVSISRQLHRLDERACNGYRDERDEKRDEKRVERLEALARGIVADAWRLHKSIPAGTEFYHQTDPRGCAVYIVPPGCKDYSRGIGVH